MKNDYSLTHGTEEVATCKIKNQSYIPYLKTEVDCPHCGNGVIKKKQNKWWGKCSIKSCGAYYCFWRPTPIQDAVLRKLNEPSTKIRWVYNIGAMNTGKTDVDMFAIIQHVMDFPGSTTLVLANDQNMYKKVFNESFEKFLMDEWLQKMTLGKEEKV